MTYEEYLSFKNKDGLTVSLDPNKRYKFGFIDAFIHENIALIEKQKQYDDYSITNSLNDSITRHANQILIKRCL